VSELVDAVSSRPDALGSALRVLLVVPAFNEESNIGRVIDEIRSYDPGVEIVVVDDGSTDRTSVVAAARGVHVLRLPFNLGIGGAVQTGYLYAFENGFDLAVQIDGDGQHDPRELESVLAPLLAGEADVVIGSRFAGRGSYKAAVSRRIGMRIFARVVSALIGQRITDTTSGFRAVNRRGIALFAADYPHDYPEVEAVVMAARQRLRLREVPVTMRRREAGRSSITAFRSLYYMVKVLVALFIGLFRRNVVPQEDS
jgi:glycosyltransferase involved in cell wall biosynthesis